MGVEIERKFLVKSDAWKPHAKSARTLEQGYFETAPNIAIRIRVDNNSKAYLTLKGNHSGISRAEFEYEIPFADARELLSTFCAPRIVKKTRHLIEHAGHTWEIDVFEGTNSNLVVAEIELASESEPFVMPPWVGTDVSHDKRYTNAHLAKHPFTTWSAP
jgi:adenylate cyclase